MILHVASVEGSFCGSWMRFLHEASLGEFHAEVSLKFVCDSF